MSLSPFLAQLPLLNVALCSGIAAYVFCREITNRVNRHFSLGLLSIALMEFGAYMYLRNATASDPYAWKQVALAGETLLPAIWLAFSFSYGREPESFRRNRNMLFAGYLLSAGFLVALVFEGAVVPLYLSTDVKALFSVYLILALVVTVANFELTLRASDHRQRWRSKFLLLGLGAIFLFLVFAHSLRLLYPAASFDLSDAFSTIVTIGCLLVLFSLVRHSLLGVDVYVSRDMIFRSFTFAFVGGFLLATAAIAQLIYTFGGSFRLYFLTLFVTVAALLLFAVLLSEKARQKTRDFIKRNFYRNKYEYRREWLEWTERLGSLTNVAELLPPVERMIYENFWVTRVVLWMYDERRNQYAVAYPADLLPGHPFSAESVSVRALIERDFPVRIKEERSADEVIGSVKELFFSLGIETVVPVAFEGELLGILGLSKSNYSAPLNHEDYDYLKIIAKQVAGVLYRAKLSEGLLELREKEAFHSFSAFVLHDLKNFIAMLSLVVANADRNFENPEFRRDMIASISKTVAKMKDLMDKLAAFSGEPKLRTSSVDLNAMLQELVAELKGVIRSRVVEEYRVVPPVELDPAAVATVVRNLVMNADESMRDGNGEVRIGTSAADGKVSISVTDNGRGMPRDFVEKELFQLFSTTKESGFGIGLYQSRKIVEAHGGAIEVESSEGMGSTFTVVLPSPEG